MLFFKKKGENYARDDQLCQKNYASTIYQSYSVLSSVPVWQSYGHPHSQNPSDIGIPCNPNHNPNREGNMRRGCPYYWKNTGKTAISVCSVILHCQKYHDLSWDTNSPWSLRDLFDRQGDFTNIDREIDNLGACKVNWLYTSFYLFLY